MFQIYESDFFKWIKSVPRSTDFFNHLLLLLTEEGKTSYDQSFEPPCINEAILDATIKNNGRVHAKFHLTLASAIFWSKQPIPQDKIQKYMPLASSCLLRDFDTTQGKNKCSVLANHTSIYHFAGVHILTLATVLVYFNAFTPELAVKIFNSEFLGNLDKLSKDPFSKVRIKLMILNKSVCCSYPQFNIPWFHENYAKELYNPKT